LLLLNYGLLIFHNPSIHTCDGSLQVLIMEVCGK